MDRRVRSVAWVAALAFIWLSAVLISIFHLLIHDAPLFPTLLGQWSLLGASLAFGAVGYYMLQTVDTPRERNHISFHAVSLFTIAGIATGGYATHQYLSPITELPLEGVLFEALFVALIGGCAGMFIGLGGVRRERDTEQIVALNHLNETARDINRAVAGQGTRAEVEQVVCNRLAESDSYKFAWVGTVDDRTGEVVPSTAANDQGYLDEVTITADESPTGQGPTGRAVRTGEPQVVRSVDDATDYEPWVRQARQRGFTASAAVPVAYEDEPYGVLNIYTCRENAFDREERSVVYQLGEIMGLAIAAVEHETELQNERERLEFFNRLIRHNLLNSLNVVEARMDVLEPYVDAEAAEHLETVSRRTDDMIDLIETLRSLMHAIDEKHDHQLEAVHLGSLLRDEIRRAEQAFDRVEFDVRGELDTRVLADDLLEEAFENLLSNAVQHNDEDIPQVTIDVEADAETVTVRITDNGPGIPDDLKDRIFGKGTKYFESPGTGFGLYLVREIIDTYGGTITVDDNDPKGSVFSVALPRARGYS